MNALFTHTIRKTMVWVAPKNTESTEITWLEVPYSEKENARKYGARWSPESNSWYAPAGIDTTHLRRWIPSARIFLDCPFAQKDEARKRGARWDREKMSWYITEDQPKQAFAEWLSGKA